MTTRQLNHPTPRLNHPTPRLNHPTPRLNHPTPRLNHPTPRLNHLTRTIISLPGMNRNLGLSYWIVRLRRHGLGVIHTMLLDERRMLSTVGDIVIISVSASVILLLRSVRLKLRRPRRPLCYLY